MRTTKDSRRCAILGTLLVVTLVAILNGPSPHEGHLRKSPMFAEPRRKLQQSTNDEVEIISDGQSSSGEQSPALDSLGPGGRAHAAWRLNFVPSAIEQPVASKALPAFLPAPTGDTHSGWAMDTTSPRPAATVAAAPAAAGSAATSLGASSTPVAPLASNASPVSRISAPATSTPAAAAPGFTKTTHTATGDLTLSLASDNEPTIESATSRAQDTNTNVKSASAFQVFSQLVQPQLKNAVSEGSTVSSEVAAAARNNILARLGARRSPPVEAVSTISLPDTTALGVAAMSKVPSSVVAAAAIPAVSTVPRSTTTTTTVATTAEAAAGAKRAPREECLAMGFTEVAQLGDCVARLEVSHDERSICICLGSAEDSLNSRPLSLRSHS